MKKIFFVLIIMSVLVIGFQPFLVSAQRAPVYDDTISGELEDIRSNTGLPGSGPDGEAGIDTTIRIIRRVLGVLALLFLIMIIYAGFRWLVSAGNPEEINKAKKTMVAAVVGVLIVMMSYGITAFVFNISTEDRWWMW